MEEGSLASHSRTDWQTRERRFTAAHRSELDERCRRGATANNAANNSTACASSTAASRSTLTGPSESHHHRMSFRSASAPCRRHAARLDRPSVSERAGGKARVNVGARETDTPRCRKRGLLYREAIFGPRKSHPAAKTYETLTAVNDRSVAGQWPASVLAAAGTFCLALDRGRRFDVPTSLLWS